MGLSQRLLVFSSAEVVVLSVSSISECIYLLVHTVYRITAHDALLLGRYHLCTVSILLDPVLVRK